MTTETKLARGLQLLEKKIKNISNSSLHVSSVAAGEHANKARRGQCAPVPEDTRVDQSFVPLRAPAVRTPPPPAFRQSSTELPSVAARCVEDAGRKRTQNTIGRDIGKVMSSLSPSAVMSTPAPPKFRPPRWTPRSRPGSGTPRRAEGERVACLPHDAKAEECESDEQEKGETSTQHPRRDNRGKITLIHVTLVLNCLIVISTVIIHSEP